MHNYCTVYVKYAPSGETLPFLALAEGKLPVISVKDAFGLLYVELDGQPGALAVDSSGSSNVPFTDGATITVNGLLVRNSDPEEVAERIARKVLKQQNLGFRV